MFKLETLEWMIFLVRKYGTMFLKGTWVTLYVSFIGTVLGFVLGFVSGIIENMSIAPKDNIFKKILVYLLKFFCKIYVEVFRGTPMIVQAMVVYYGLYQSNIKIPAVQAAILVTLLNTGAYMAETVRAGIQAVDFGQQEGAMAIGMSHMQLMIYVVLPQAIRNIIPEMGNTFVSNLKSTSILNVIGVYELYMTAKVAAGVYYRYFESFLIIAIIYLILSVVATKLLKILEKKLSGPKDYKLAEEFMQDEQGV